MKNIVPTVTSALLQTNQRVGKTHVVQVNTSLNQKLEIQADLVNSDTDVLSMKYVVIGIGGHAMGVAPNGLTFPKGVEHTTRHTGLYMQVPFVMRLPSDDLSPTERLKYRLRRQKVHNGVTYVEYWAKVLDLANTNPQLELRTVVDGVTNSEPYVPLLSDLNPVPPVLANGQVLVTNGNYVASTAKVPFEMTPADILEFINVCNILFGTPDLAIISEVGLCSGVDRAVSGDFNGVSTGYMEAIAVQICTHINTFFTANFGANNNKMTLDLGVVEPLLTVS